MKCFSLFSGIGCFDLALVRNEHEVVGACEIDQNARRVYQRHFPNIKIWEDATKLNPTELPEFDLLCAGFPCQSFSIAGKRLGFDDLRGTVFFEIARIVKEKRPELLLLENVAGLLTHDGGKTFEVICNTLNSLGYLVDFRCINTNRFLPQNRRRIFIIGHSIREFVKDGQIKKENSSKKIIQNYLLEILLDILTGEKKQQEHSLKEWGLSYLINQELDGLPKKLNFLKNYPKIKYQIKRSDYRLTEQQLLFPNSEIEMDLQKKKNEIKNHTLIKLDTTESQMEEEIDCGIIDWLQNEVLEENLPERKKFTISIWIKPIIEKKTFTCAEIKAIIIGFIFNQWNWWENWLKEELSVLTELQESTSFARRKNQITVEEERYLLRNKLSMERFTENQSGELVRSVGGEPIKQVFPLGEISDVFEKESTSYLPSLTASDYKGPSKQRIANIIVEEG